MRLFLLLTVVVVLLVAAGAGSSTRSAIRGRRQQKHFRRVLENAVARGLAVWDHKPLPEVIELASESSESALSAGGAFDGLGSDTVELIELVNQYNIHVPDDAEVAGDEIGADDLREVLRQHCVEIPARLEPEGTDLFGERYACTECRSLQNDGANVGTSALTVPGVPFTEQGPQVNLVVNNNGARPGEPFSPRTAAPCGSFGSSWVGNAPPGENDWIGIDMGNTTRRLTYFQMCSGESTGPQADQWAIQGSHNGAVWYTIYEYDNDNVSPFAAGNSGDFFLWTSAAAPAEVRALDDNGPDFVLCKAYRYFRYIPFSTTNATQFYTSIAQIHLFGLTN